MMKAQEEIRMKTKMDKNDRAAEKVMTVREEEPREAVRTSGMKAISIIMWLNSSRDMRIRLPMKAGSEI